MSDSDWNKFIKPQSDSQLYSVEVVRQEGEEVVEDNYDNAVSVKFGDSKTSRTVLQVETADGDLIFYNFEGVHFVKTSRR